MRREKDIQQRIVHRLKIAQGHLAKVVAMAEAQAYCIDVLHQSQAVQKALREVDNLLIENHLKSCVVEAMRDGKTNDAIAEVMEVFKKHSYENGDVV